MKYLTRLQSVSTNKMHITAWLSTLILSFSQACKSRVAPKSVQITQLTSGFDMMRSSLCAWLIHWYCPTWRQHISSCIIIFLSTSFTTSLVQLSSSCVQPVPFFLNPCLAISFHSSKSISVLFSVNFVLSLILCIFLIPQSTHLPWRQSHQWNEGIRWARPIPHARLGWGSLLQQIFCTKSSACPESKGTHVW